MQCSGFEILKDALGSGGYGAVVKAQNKQTGQSVAAKVISTRRMKETAIMKEVHVMKMLDHDHIIRLLHHEFQAPNHIIFMELATHGELFSYVIDKGALQEVEAKRFFNQLMEAVDYMHKQGVVHRDLKLENVLLDEKDNCKVCDFGLAHTYSRSESGKPILTTLTEVCGSKSYCAPEVLQNHGYDGFPMDVWSCGICLFAMLAGFFPLDEASGADWRYERLRLASSHNCSAAKTIFGFYDRECQLSKACTSLIDGCLSLAPKSRLTVQQVLDSPWLGGGGKTKGMDGMIVDDDHDSAPVYRGWGMAADMSRDQINALIAEAGEQPESPVYRGGPGSGPPPMLARQNCNFCADFHLEEEA